jgi:hypothetical protein
VGRALRFCGRGICTALPSDMLLCLGFTDDVSGIGRCEGSRVNPPPFRSRPACVWVGQARLPVCARRMRGLSTATPIHRCVCTVSRALARVCARGYRDNFASNRYHNAASRVIAQSVSVGGREYVCADGSRKGGAPTRLRL